MGALSVNSAVRVVVGPVRFLEDLLTSAVGRVVVFLLL